MSGPLRKALNPSLRELRLHFCQTSGPSAGARAFVQSVYPDVKANNPDLPILIREARSVIPRAFARFEKGVEKQVSLADATDGAEVERRIAELL